MLSTLLIIFTLVLMLVCILVVLVILMQRPSADAGMGASLGGGAAESAFGGETGNVLTKMSVRGIVTFFILTFLLFIGGLYLKKSNVETTAPATTSLGAIFDETAKTPEAPAAPAVEAPKAAEIEKPKAE